MLVLIVEDDRQLAACTITFLNNEGIDVDYADNLYSAKHIAEQQNYDAIVLDIGLPDGLGFSLAEHFAKTHPNTPLLFLTAEHQLQSKLKAFSLGALDYLTKPFELAELSIRLKLLKAKKINTVSQSFLLADLNVNLNQRIAMRHQRPITLSPQQWQLLQLLIEYFPHPVDKRIILETLWPDQDVSSDMYKTLISRLRSNLSKPNEKPLLHTLKGIGVLLREKC
ncbi:response regulator transcription factor [Pseudoalteromonas sp.]|uniref:response regulator transcription factor n=1 Tax=Pseudoalteromonas sp. TaxID=53249 RepID=UPI0035616F02